MPSHRNRTPLAAPKRARSLRARVQTSIVAVTALAVVLFAVPLGIAVRTMYRSEAVTSLQRDATRVTAVVPDTVAVDTSGVHLPRDLPSDLTVGVYTVAGRLIREHGPSTSALAAAARDGGIHVAVEGSDLAVSVPVPSDQTVAATVRVAIPNSVVEVSTLSAWAVMALLGACVVGIAALLARRQARRIAVPLERLTESARALGDGDFTIHTGRSGIHEADALAEAIESTARRLGDVLDRERAFSTHVSHQLRTPLTGLLLGLESALSRPNADLGQATRTALRRGEQLQATIEDLLRLARDTHPRGDPLAVAELLDLLHDQWHSAFAERGRPLRVSVAPGLPETRASATAVRHVVDVLVSNALTHGAGEVTVAADAFADGLLIEVTDEGPGLPDADAAFDPRNHGAPFAPRNHGAPFAPRTDPAGTHGIGLAMARSLAEAEGGRLLLRRAAPRPMFSLLLPTV